MNRPRAATLAIGTEITDGQIIDRNSAWISQKLTNLGFVITEHRSTPDDSHLMAKAIDELVGRNDYLFVTGGLGPTSDDFTRNVVAEYFKLPLVFDSASWEQVTERLKSRGVPVSGSQRKQCEFPEGSTVLRNRAGTANGFLLEKNNVKVYVLPGPPHEIASVWEEGIAERLSGLVSEAAKEKLFKFRCIGRGESEFADMTERIFAGVEGVRLGYRAHAPYVEVKVWVPAVDVAKFTPQLQSLEQELSPHLINCDEEDLAEQLFVWLENGNALRVIDLASGGLFAERLLAQARETKRVEKAISLTMATEFRQSKLNPGDTKRFAPAAASQECVLVMAIASGSSDFVVGISTSNIDRELVLPSPFNLKPESERARKFLVEKALQMLRDNVISP